VTQKYTKNREEVKENKKTREEERRKGRNILNKERRMKVG
jgi:hypothetical protein